MLLLTLCQHYNRGRRCRASFKMRVFLSDQRGSRLYLDFIYFLLLRPSLIIPAGLKLS